MAAVDTAPKEASAVALPGLGRALISAGKLTQKAAEDIYKKSQISRSSFIAELTGSGAVSAADLAHTVSAVFGAPLLDLEAIDPVRLPKELLDPKICQAYKVIVLSKRNNRLIVATADPTDQEAAEKIKFTTQMGVDWIIAEYDKLNRLVEETTKSTAQTMDTLVSGGGDFEFDDAPIEEAPDNSDSAATDVEDAPIVKFLHKMLLDAFNMRASDLHFEPYEHQYRVRFRIDGELREIASPPIAIKDKLASRIKVISRLDISETRVPQ
ncbi:ATPase, T2SS/T4P/T4SS family, partial [Acidovorax sp.]|uniref:ATPase, T2SS/T4P/T4SS family n=1 Tax=Acidovorax sp. TaxID=1872122 RepID=UPI0025C5BEDC